MALVTVITPTYNRANCLDTLFQSLQNQTCTDFVWLIVDDGSEDDTKNKAAGFIERASFQVNYVHKENGGKHSALNVGIRTSTTELIFIVDSDDEVMADGIETIVKFYHKYKDVPRIGMLSFLRKSRKHGVVLEMPVEELIGSYVQQRIIENRPGDMAEVFWTKALQQFPFPEFAGEKFLSEDVVWIPLGISYAAVYINRPIYEFDYLEDGLTSNDKKHKFASPLGSMMRGKMLMLPECGIKANFRGAIIYSCYRREVSMNIPKILKLTVRERILTAVVNPLGRFFNKKWRKEATKN